MRRIPKGWRWAVAGLAAAVVGALLLPIGDILWIYLLMAVGLLALLIVMADREVPFALARAQWRLGPDDESVLRARFASAAQCIQQARIPLAITRLDALVPDLTEALGAQHPLTFQARFLALQLRGDSVGLPDRLTALGDLSDEMDLVLGPAHPESLAARCALGEWLEEEGEPERALAVYEEAVRAGTQELGADHHVTLIARGSLAILRCRTAGTDRGAALTDLAEVVRDMDRTLGAEHPNTVSTRRLLDQWKDTRPDPAGT
ncbi:tetratricopeptide repeat protein [Streptomyces sp. NPDC094149]|uniref:tetratricopeptide repeat protein n=1 Tax=Streptomyces sp. NPDC094149 TaxID=3155079 RepID=UPI0033209414